MGKDIRSEWGQYFLNRQILVTKNTSNIVTKKESDKMSGRQETFWCSATIYEQQRCQSNCCLEKWKPQVFIASVFGTWVNSGLKIGSGCFCSLIHSSPCLDPNLLSTVKSSLFPVSLARLDKTVYHLMLEVAKCMHFEMFNFFFKKNNTFKNILLMQILRAYCASLTSGLHPHQNEIVGSWGDKSRLLFI